MTQIKQIKEGQVIHIEKKVSKVREIQKELSYKIKLKVKRYES